MSRYLKENLMDRVVQMLQQIAESNGVALPSPTESLFDSKILDSFGLLEFVTAIEEELNVKIPDEDLDPSNFESIAKIRTYINGRLER